LDPKFSSQNSASLKSVSTSLSFATINYFTRGHAVAQWLSCYVTSREVADSRPDEVNDFFQFT
jgi:hypothetical protein